MSRNEKGSRHQGRGNGQGVSWRVLQLLVRWCSELGAGGVELLLLLARLLPELGLVPDYGRYARGSLGRATIAVYI